MIDEMHDEEETYTSIGTVVEMEASLLPAIGEIIAPKEETLVILQDVSKYQLSHSMHLLSSHIFSVPLIENYGNMPSGPLHDQISEQHANLKQQNIIV